MASHDRLHHATDDCSRMAEVFHGLSVQSVFDDYDCMAEGNYCY